MLSHLHVHDLVIVRDLDLSFADGMTALTGETGAGKSILIDALGLALGDRADNGMIRAGADRAEVTAVFELTADSDVLTWLAENDLGADGDCLLRRVLVRDGRSRAYINGTPVAMTLLRTLGERLVDIHGQHAHQSLLRAAAQRELLDAYAGLTGQRNAVSRSYRDWQAARDAHEQLRIASDDRASRLDYLNFQIAELAELPLDDASLDALSGEQMRLAHAERLLGDSGRIAAVLGDDDDSARARLHHAQNGLATLAAIDPTLTEAAGMIESAAIQVDEALDLLRRYQDRIEPDPDRLRMVDEQLARVHDVARKHRVAPDGLATLLNDLQAEAEGLCNADTKLALLEQNANAAAAAYQSAAAQLSAARAEAAARLSTTITDSMQTLGMDGGQLRIDCETDASRPGAAGIDQIRFLVATNPGQLPGALSDVASGGELSRISLAIQVATASCGSVPTLIFDEVDVGIGGATAEVVGRLLAAVGAARQVLCVTHLAQVAAQANAHLRVHKISDGRTAETRIDALDAQQRVDEIARMLGGVEITDQTLRHAAEMIERARRAS